MGRKQDGHLGWDVISCWKAGFARPRSRRPVSPLESAPAFNTNHCPH